MTSKVCEQFFPTSIFVLSYDAPIAPTILHPQKTHLLTPGTQYLAIFGRQKALMWLNHSPGKDSHVTEKKRLYCLWLTPQLPIKG